MKLQDLHEATSRSAEPTEVEAVLKRWFIKNVFKADYKEVDVDYHFMNLTEWQQHKWDQLRFNSHKLRCGIDLRRAHHFLNHENVRGLDRHPEGREWREKIEELFNNLLKPLGWFVFSVSNYSFTFDPIKQDTVNVPAKLYHFSPFWTKDSILKKGLIPKGANGKYEDDYKYPPRVHLYTKWDRESMSILALHIFNHGMGIETMYHSGFQHTPVVYYEIDTSKLRRGTKFYQDVSVADGVWTYTHIPPEAISVKDEDPVPEEDEDKS